MAERYYKNEGGEFVKDRRCDPCFLHDDIKNKLHNHEERILTIENLLSAHNERMASIQRLIEKVDNSQEILSQKISKFFFAVLLGLGGFFIYYIQQIPM